MIKREELSDPNSCMNRAEDGDMTFVLLGRDPAAPAAIHAWVQARIQLGKNVPGDAQITEARQAIARMGSYKPASKRARTDAEDNPNG